LGLGVQQYANLLSSGSQQIPHLHPHSEAQPTDQFEGCNDVLGLPINPSRSCTPNNAPFFRQRDALLVPSHEWIFWPYIQIHVRTPSFVIDWLPDEYIVSQTAHSITFKFIARQTRETRHLRVRKLTKWRPRIQVSILSSQFRLPLTIKDWHTQDLFEAIQKGEYPSWTCYVQVLSPEQAEKFRWNIFDLTKVWPQKEVPLRRFGRFTLNRNPENYFAEIEQAAFSPSHLVPGVEPSADPVLQSRLFSYPDTHRHRLGVNYQQIPVNRPLNAFNPYQRDGVMAVNGNYGRNPAYPSSYRQLNFKPVKPSQVHEQWAGAVLAQQIPVS
jgi:catalase